MTENQPPLDPEDEKEEIVTKHPNANYRLCLSLSDLDELKEELKNAKLVGFDTETTGLNFFSHDPARVVGLCFSTKPFTGWYVPIRHEVAEGVIDPRQLPVDTVISQLRPLLESQNLIGHNTKFDYHAMMQDGVKCNFVHDTMIIASLLGTFPPGTRGLKALVSSQFSWKQLEIHQIHELQTGEKPKKKIKEIHFQKYDIDLSLDYAASDADWTLQLYHKLWEVFYKQYEGKTQIYDLEMQLVPVVAEMEAAGVPFDVQALKDQAVTCAIVTHRTNEAIMDSVEELYGERLEVNLGSHQQLRDLLFNKLGFTPNPEKVTGTGELSTGKEVLQELAEEYPFVQKIVTYKALKKLYTSYLTKLPTHCINGRVYAQFNQMGTDTGRFSSREPNLQQMPKDQIFLIREITDWSEYAAAENKATGEVEAYIRERLDKDGRSIAEVRTWDSPDSDFCYSIEGTTVYESWYSELRNTIKASDDKYIIEVDYSQVELRIFAGETQEPNLMAAFSSGEDVHRRTASVVFNVDSKDVTKKQRSQAKTINFGIIYGAGATKISESENIPFEEAEQIVQNYFKGLPKAHQWILDQKAIVRERWYSLTRLGRQRRFDKNFQMNSFKHIAVAEREGVNAIIQGTAADIMKVALVRLNSMLKREFGDKAKTLMTVHDSVVFEVSREVDPSQIVPVIQKAMTDFSHLPVISHYPPLTVDVQIGPSWGEGKGYEEDSVLLEVPKSLPPKEKPPTKWVLHIYDTLSPQKYKTLKAFINSRRNPKASNTLRVEVTNGVKDETIQLEERFDIAFPDEIFLQRNLGTCKLLQEEGGVDYRAAFEGLNDKEIGA